MPLRSHLDFLHASDYQVDGCGVDLSGDDVKKYQQRNRVCGTHQKDLVVILRGRECRYCQQVWGKVWGEVWGEGIHG